MILRVHVCVCVCVCVRECVCVSVCVYVSVCIIRCQYFPDAERFGETRRLRLQREVKESHDDARRTDDQCRRSWYSGSVYLPPF